MKNLSLAIALLLCSISCLRAQSVNDLFQKKTQLANDYHAIASKYEALEINPGKLNSLKGQSPSALKMQLPFENSQLKLDLKKVNITTGNFSVIEALPGGGRRTTAYTQGSFYQGKIEGQENSFATIAIFNNQVIGVIADNESNIVLGAIERNGVATNEYTLYREDDLRIPNPFSCATSEIPEDGSSTTHVANTVTTEATGEPIEIYFECDFKFYQDKGSNTQNVINYVLGFFNNTALIYNNEDLKVQVSQILVWTTQDPEAAAGLNTTSAVLPAFRTRMQSTTYIGDYAHFLSTRPLGGGIAYLLNNPCSSPTNRVAVSAINNTYNNFPTYSWTVMVVTHELGHNFGSNHTQWCGWTGGAIDNCYTTEGGCPPGPPPVNGGTIMSYCHTVGAGINLNNGFGQQPGAKIRQVIGAAACFGNCRMTISLTKVDASCGQNNGSATVTAVNGTGTTTYSWSNGQTGATLSNVGPGTYNVTVSNAGCQVMDVVTIINSGPTLNAVLTPASPTSFCTGGSVLLTVTNNAAYSYQWYRNAVIISGAISNTYTATSTGNYSVVVTSGACTVTPSVQITEVPVPAAIITPGGATTFCAGGSVVLNGNAGGSYTYQWYNNAAPIGGATNPTYTATSSGNYTVKVSAGTCEATSAPVIVTVNSLPSAVITAGGPITFCSGGSVALNASTGTGYSYQWYNNAALISGANSATYNATASGSYTVRVTANTCEVTSAAVIVTVVPTPVANITPGSATTFCAGGSVVLNGNAGGSYSYQWYNNAVLIGGAINPTYTATASGSYTVKVFAGNCEATSTPVAVTVNSLPQANVTAGSATTFCTGGSVALTASTGSGYTYQWYNNAVLIGGANSATYNATASGSYTVRVTANNCEVTSASIVVTVVALPVASITPGSATTFCAGGSVVLNGNAGGSYSYQWYNNTVLIGGATNPTYTATASGNYTVRVYAGNCEATSAPVVVTVNPFPQANVTAGGATTFCSGSSVTLNAGTGTGYTYQWYNNNSIINNATGASYNANAGGSYTVRVTANNCEATSPAMVVTVNQTPVAAITAGGPVAFCTGDNVTLNAATGSGYTYQWFNNGVAINNATNSSYTATVSGNYTVRVTANTCEATSSATTVTVSPTPQAVITAAGATNFCDGGNVLINANTGIGYTYQWYRNGVAINNATNSSYQATGSGNYTVMITLGTCLSASSATTVMVWANPVVTVTPAASTIQKFQTQTLNASGAVSYNWTAQAALVSSTATSGIVKPLTTTNYLIEGTDNNNCKGTASATVTVIGCGDVTGITATAYSPSRVIVKWTNPQGVTADTLQYRKVGATAWTKVYVTGQEYELNGLDPAASYEYNVIALCNTTTVFLPSGNNTFNTAALNDNVYIKLFPNPVNTDARLEIVVDKPFTMQAIVYDNNGKQVMNISPNQSYSAGQLIKQINPQRLANGMYHIAVTINGKVYTVKMLVHH